MVLQSEYCKTFNFSRTKYGGELLIDLIRLESLAKYIRREPRHCLTYYDITLIWEGNRHLFLHHQNLPVATKQVYF